MKRWVVGLAFALWAGAAWAQDTVFQDPLGEAAKLVATRLAGMAEAKKGVVGHVDTTVKPPRLYVAMPDVAPGQFLSIQSIGKPILIGGEEVGREETAVGIAEVERRQNEKLVICKLVKAEAGIEPKVGDAAYLRPVPDSLAVTAFTRPDGAVNALGTELADRLEQALGTTGKFTIVERKRLDALLGEHKLAVSDLFDATKTTALGQLLQAKGVVVGTIALGETTLAINVRVVDLASGVQTATAKVDVGASDELRRKYGAAAGLPATPGPGAAATSTGPAATAPAGAVACRSAVSTELGNRINLDFVRAAAARNHENVTLGTELLTWTFASRNTCYLYPDGALVVTCPKPLDSVAVLDQLDTDLAAAIGLVAQVVPNVTTEEILGKRFGSSRYWADQPGVLHRLYLGSDKLRTWPEKLQWVINVPDVKVIGARVLAFGSGERFTGNFAVWFRDQQILPGTPSGELLVRPLSDKLLTYGQHNARCELGGLAMWSRSESGFMELQVVTPSTTGRFSVTGDLADRFRILVNGLTAELFGPQ